LEEGVANVDWDRTKVREEIEKRRWYPVYGEYEYDAQGDK
jgi:malate dehydrogenase (oxaloacetate-decarboxylating)